MTDPLFYNRQPTTHIDGSRLRYSITDALSEDATARLLEVRWRCEIKPFALLCPVDFYAVRDGRMVGVLELKTRSHPSDKYPTVFLSARKWLALQMAKTGFGVPALFVVRFANELKWIEVGHVNAANIAIGGTVRMVKAPFDIEPVIHVPVDEMHRLTTIVRATPEPPDDDELPICDERATPPGWDE